GNYSAYAAKQKTRSSEPRERPAPRKTQGANVKQKRAIGDNPYLRPFGRLSVKELEKQITETEIALSECQSNFADTDSFKDPGPDLGPNHRACRAGRRSARGKS